MATPQDKKKVVAAGPAGADPNVPLEPERRRITLSELYAELKDSDPRHRKAIKSQLDTATKIKFQLTAAENKRLRSKDVARDAAFSDLSDNLTAAWRRIINIAKHGQIQVLIESELHGGIIWAQKETKTLDARLALLVVMATILVVTTVYWQPISDYLAKVFENPALFYGVIGASVILSLVIYLFIRSRRMNAANG